MKYYKILFIRIGLLLGLYTAFRFLFFALNSSLFDPISLREWLEIVYGGFRFDLSIHTYIYTYKYICTYAYTYTCIHTYIHNKMFQIIWTMLKLNCTNWIHINTNTYILTPMHTHTHAYTHTYTHTYIHTYTYTYTYTYIHIHT